MLSEGITLELWPGSEVSNASRYVSDVKLFGDLHSEPGAFVAPLGLGPRAAYFSWLVIQPWLNM